MLDVYTLLSGLILSVFGLTLVVVSFVLPSSFLFSVSIGLVVSVFSFGSSPGSLALHFLQFVAPRLIHPLRLVVVPPPLSVIALLVGGRVLRLLVFFPLPVEIGPLAFLVHVHRLILLVVDPLAGPPVFPSSIPPGAHGRSCESCGIQVWPFSRIFT